MAETKNAKTTSTEAKTEAKNTPAKKPASTTKKDKDTTKTKDAPQKGVKDVKEVAKENKEKRQATKEEAKKKVAKKVTENIAPAKKGVTEAKAVAKYVRMSPSKLKPVADLVRGKDLNEALTILKFTTGKGAELVEKVIQSAASNAENNFDMESENLYVAEISADYGPTMKRWRAGAQGRASIILKRTSHISVTLKEKKEK